CGDLTRSRTGRSLAGRPPADAAVCQGGGARMKLSELLRDVPVRAVGGDLDVDITSVTPDSRLVTKGTLFVAIPGTAQDGTAFLPQAVEKGAAAVVVTGTANRADV